jgi:hypothetical protein
MENIESSTEKPIANNFQSQEKTKASSESNKSFESEKLYASSDEEKIEKKDQDMKTFTNEVVIIRPEQFYENEDC